MSPVISFVTGLIEREISQIHVTHGKLGYHIAINGREVEIFQGPGNDKWYWRVTDCAWWEAGFMDCKPREYDCYSDAAQDALDKLRAPETEEDA